MKHKEGKPITVMLADEGLEGSMLDTDALKESRLINNIQFIEKEKNL